MALQSFQLDPAAGGVSQLDFDTHAHNYRRIDGIGIDDIVEFTSPDRSVVTDDAETIAGSIKNAKSIGVTVSTRQTTAPV